MNSFKAVLAGVAAVFLSVSAQAGVADRIVAVVNNEVITLSELNDAFGPYQTRVEASYEGQEREKALSENKLSLLNRLIDNLLMEQQARKAKLVIKDDEVDGVIKDLLARRNSSPDELKKALEKDGMTLELYKKGVRDQLMRLRLVQREVKTKVAISDEEIGSYYLKHREDYEGKETARVRQILLAAPKEDDPAEKEKRREKAEAIRGRLLGGEPFESLSAQFSQGPAAATGGDIGFIERGMVLPEIEAAAFSLPLNEISPVIESPAGFHILQVTDRRGVGVKAIETVREEIREKLDEEKMGKKFEEWLDELRKKSHIEIKL
jgi:peptidyl-prolyl cis-trans isomerase SurA